MDKHTANDPLNPINHEPQTKYCDICDVEESKTYFIEDTNTCESCHDEIKKEDAELIKIAYNKTDFNINTKL
tara:strand:+ start:41 stop:256 length:216 start_codon:yes stop_codon:yes gene_type:complete